MIDKKIKNFIKSQASKNAPKECCGFIVEKNNNISCVNVENIAQDPVANFQISAIDFLNTKKLNDSILYIYHSHVNDDFNFSQLDISTSDNLNIPFVLYTIKNNDYKFYFPTNFKKRYIGRYFKIGENDCFTFIKEYFLKELNVNIEPIFKNYTSHIEAQTVFNKNLEFNFLEKNNFFKIEKDDLNVNDLLVISTLFGKHFAIYIGNNKIIHQPIFGFSKIENYCNFYRRHTVLAYRKKIW
jgi:proteasome lid subunit RPN8/RPN11